MAIKSCENFKRFTKSKTFYFFTQNVEKMKNNLENSWKDS